MLESDDITSTTPAPRKRAPRKATAPTTTPPEAPPVAATAAEVEAPARKRAPRKAARKAVAPEQTPAAQPAADQLPIDPPVTTSDPTATVEKKAPAKRTRKAAKAALIPEFGTGVDSVAMSPDSTADDAGPATKTPRKRAAKKAAGAPAQAEPAEQSGSDGSASEPAPAMAAPGVLFMAPPTDEPAPRRRRVAKKAAGAPADAPPAEANAPGPATTDTATSDTASTGTASTGTASTGTASTDTAAEAATPPKAKRTRAKKSAAAPLPQDAEPTAATPDEDATDTPADDTAVAANDATPADAAADEGADPEDVREAAIEQASGARRRRRRGRRGRGGGNAAGDGSPSDDAQSDDGPSGDAQSDTDADDQSVEDTAESGDAAEGGEGTANRRRRRRRRSSGSGDDESGQDDPPNTVTHVREPKKQNAKDAEDDGVRGVKGSTRLEAKRQRRRDGRETTRRRAPILTESEFLARREAVDRVMAVRQLGDRTQIAVLEDDIVVEHYVTRASATSYVGNVYLGRVQNVLPSMEAAFIDIGKGRNGVLYAGEVNWDAAGLEGKSRTIQDALKSGDSVLVQVTKNPIGHKGARLTSQISLPGRFLVYVPGGGMTGISRRLPDTERSRLKSILKKIVPEDAGVIVRTAAEGASEEDLTHDVSRLQAQWESVQQKAAQKKSAPVLVHGEPDLAIRVVRDVFNEDFKSLVVDGSDAWNTVSEYVQGVSPDLAQRVSRHTKDTDLFHDLRVDEQLTKALDRKVFLPSGGSLVIDRTEAMTVVDVNTGKFVGTGGNLEQTVTRNNLEAAEEIVRQLRLRDVGGIIVIDFIDMVLESNRELVLRRLTECLGRDRTKHQVAEVTSLGLVQMTRKRVGEGLLEAFSEPCEHCRGRGVVVHSEPVDQSRNGEQADEDRSKSKRRRGGRGGASEPDETPIEPAASEEQRQAANAAIAAIHRAAALEKAEPSSVVDELATGLVRAAMQVDSHGVIDTGRDVHSDDRDGHASDGLTRNDPSSQEVGATSAGNRDSDGGASMTLSNGDEAVVPPGSLESASVESASVESVPVEPAPVTIVAHNEPADPTREAVISTAAVEVGTTGAAADPASSSVPEQAVPQPSPEDLAGADAPPSAGRRRRRAASRPAGPPVPTG